MARIAIIGAGNIGCYLGAHLRAAGEDVFFCVRRAPAPFRVEGLPRVSIPVFSAAPPKADFALVAVKAQDAPSAMPWLRAVCRENSVVAVLQNGVRHEEGVAPFRATPVLSYVYVEAEDGLYRGFSPPREEFTVPDDEGGRRFRDLLSGTKLRVKCEALFRTAAWKKMLHNCVSNPLTALAGRGLEILHEPEYASLAREVLLEALPVARREGAELPDSIVDETIAMLLSYPPGTRTSMLQDRERGRPLEVGALNGTLVELGRLHGLPVEANERLLRRLNNESNQATAG